MKKMKMVLFGALLALALVGCGGSSVQDDLKALDYNALLPQLELVEDDVQGVVTNNTAHDISLAVFYYSDKAANEDGSFTARTIAAGEKSEKMEAYAPQVEDVKQIEIEAADFNFSTAEGDYCVKYDYKEAEVLEVFPID